MKMAAAATAAAAAGGSGAAAAGGWDREAKMWVARAGWSTQFDNTLHGCKREASDAGGDWFGDEVRSMIIIILADVLADRSGKKRPAPDVSPARKKSRDRAAATQSKQADGMRERAYNDQGPMELGTIVNLPIAFQDRPRLSPTTITLVVLAVCPYSRHDMDGRDFFVVGNANNGYLKMKYARDSLTTTQKMSPALLGIPNVVAAYEAGLLEERTLRQLITAESSTGGEGAGRCYCAGQCNTKQCSCFKTGVPCRSCCHAPGHRRPGSRPPRQLRLRRRRLRRRTRGRRRGHGMRNTPLVEMRAASHEQKQHWRQEGGSEEGRSEEDRHQA